MNMSKTWQRMFHTLGAAFIGYTILDSSIQISVFSGPSMEPTIQENDVGLVEKLTPYKKFQRGDIVIATSPDNPSIQICKRILALEGGRITSDGSYALWREKRVVPRGHVWLEGDNKDNSTDSRQFGAIPLGLVHCRLLAKISPKVEWLATSNIPVNSS
ncbi:mitochondrial inner membrane protease subunit 1-like [Ciona intestinalis]